MHRTPPADLRQRLELVSVGDGSPRPLIDKILARPLLVERLRTLIGDTSRALILPFMTTPGEMELAARLGVPVYGADPSLAVFGTKSGGRRLFAEAGIPHPRGREGVHSVSDLVEAIRELRADGGNLREVMVKLDDSAGGLGNAVVDLEGAEEESDLRHRIEHLELEDSEGSRDEFLAELERGRRHCRRANSWRCLP